MSQAIPAGQPLTGFVTVGQCLTDWLSGKKALSTSTRRIYQSHLRNYLIPYLGQVRLDKLRASQVSDMFHAIAAASQTASCSRAAPTQSRRGGD